MTTRERAPTVREADLETMRALLGPLAKAFLGWEDLWRYYGDTLPPRYPGKTCGCS